MSGRIAVGIGLALVWAAFPAAAATKAPGKAAPACAAIRFRPLPQGMADGEQEAGMYRSRNGRLELRGEVKQGTPVNYYVTTGGKRIAAAPASLPEVAASCAAAKKMPKPETPVSTCTGQRFTVVVAHAGEQRFALLYGGEQRKLAFLFGGELLISPSAAPDCADGGHLLSG
jgi:hypothetical protein